VAGLTFLFLGESGLETLQLLFIFIWQLVAWRRKLGVTWRRLGVRLPVHAQLLSLLEGGSHLGIRISRGKILDCCLVQMLGGARSGRHLVSQTAINLLAQHPVVEREHGGRMLRIVDQEAIIIGVHRAKGAGAGGVLAFRPGAHLNQAVLLSLFLVGLQPVKLVITQLHLLPSFLGDISPCILRALDGSEIHPGLDSKLHQARG